MVLACDGCSPFPSSGEFTYWLPCTGQIGFAYGSTVYWDNDSAPLSCPFIVIVATYAVYVEALPCFEGLAPIWLPI